MNSENNTFKVGDILLGTWGYEACIATFAQVTAVKPKSIVVREIGQTRKNQDCMNWVSTPNRDEFVGPPMVKKVTKYNSIKWTNYCGLHKWSGSPVECYNVH